MSNWCANWVRITGDADTIKAIKQHVHHSADNNIFSFQKIRPMPDELMTTDSPNNDEELRVALIAAYGYPSWYEWAVVKWGTKWDTLVPELLDDSETRLEYRFDTAWTPPIPVIQTLSADFPDATVVLEFDEPGMDYWGMCRFRGGVCIERLDGPSPGEPVTEVTEQEDLPDI